MTFNPLEHLVSAPSTAYELGSGPIITDSSTINELRQVINTTTAPVPGDALAPGNFNGIDVVFDTNIGSGARVRFDKSYIKVDGTPCDANVGIDRCVTSAVGIPWNSIAALFESAEVQLNQSANTLEQITQNLGHASMVKMLTRYSREALEGMDDMLFTPCIEERRDVVGGWPLGVGIAPVGISQTTLTRVNKQLRYSISADVTNHNTWVPRRVSKNIYLSELFDSLRIPAAVPTTNIHIKVHTKAADEILFEDVSVTLVTAASNRFFITGISLHLVLENMTEEQLKIETQKVLSHAVSVRESFLIYDAVVKQYTAGSNYRDSNIKNMQGCVVMFPSTETNELTGVVTGPPIVTARLGINPYQYCYNSATSNTINGINMFQTRYGQFQVPSTALTIAGGARATTSRNSDLYQLYRNLSGMLVSHRFTPPLEATSMYDSATPPFPAAAAIPFQVDAATSMGVIDLAPYVLFCAPFFPQTTHSHKTMSGDDHEVFLAGGGNVPSRCVIVRIRSGFAAIKGDTSISIMN